MNYGARTYDDYFDGTPEELAEAQEREDERQAAREERADRDYDEMRGRQLFGDDY